MGDSTRLTLKETAALLGKSRHWIYANCYALGLRPQEWLLEAPDFVVLVWRAFVSGSYGRYPYDVLASRSWAVDGGKLSGKSLKEAWRRHVSSAEDACEFLFAMAAAQPDASVANHAAYVHRIAGGKDFFFRERLKEYAFGKLVGLFLRGEVGLGKIGLTSAAGALPKDQLEELKVELRRLIKT